MSWAASYPPPPRRTSRSRSPMRGMAYGGRPPLPDQYPAPDFDPYHDRERPYAPGMHERPPYDHGGRRRSRSPLGDESRKRRRSASPYDRDRYEPRPRYADDYDTHSRSYDYGRRSYGGRRPMDPRTADYPVSLRQYAEWFRYTYPDEAAEEDRLDKEAEVEAGDGSKPRNGLRTLWEKYKKEFAQNQLQIMFDHHKKSPWFAEKYDPAPEFEQMRQRLRKEGWKGRVSAFLDDLEAGKYDPEAKEPEPTSATKDAVNGDSDSKPKPEAGGDEDSQFPMDTEEDAGDADASRNNANGQADGEKRADHRDDELAVPVEGNQVMIRTIPPDIGRVKLEEAICHLPGYHYLALGDPLQKRNFYRAGWIRFTEEADMSATMNELIDKKIDGFKLHVTHNQRPFIGKIRYAPEVASRPARLAKDLASARHLASILEDQAASLRQSKVKKPQPPKPEGAPAEGDEPPPEPEYDEEEEDPRERGTDAVERRIDTVMQNLQEQGLVDSSNEKAYEEKKVVVSLDLFIAYLRAAFNTCFYCCVVTDHVEELQRKCVKHERKPLSAALGGDEAMDVKEEGAQDQEEGKKEEDGEKKKDRRRDGGRDWKRNDERWLEWHDSKLALLVSRDEVDPRDYGGKNYDEELAKTVEPYIKREEEHKFRCKSCQKLFKAATFVEKHVANKHPDLLKALDDLTYFNNFALDPHRIQPFSHPPPVVGNAPPPQAYGLQASAQYAQQPDFGRGGGFPDAYGAAPPMNMNGRGAYDMPPYMGTAPGYGGFPPGYGGFPPGPPMAGGGRRLAERMGGYAEPPMGLPPPGAGLPAKPMHLLEGPLMAGNGMMGGGPSAGGGGGGGRWGGRGGGPVGPPPPPPPDAKEDPRAARGARVSYHDMDEVAEGDIQLQY
ncbi:hypothetical protein HDZ31DRAFT_38253 [Schizophyllum fasciatum]